MRTLIISFLLLVSSMFVFSQEPRFTRQDTLRGSITPEREWWDVTYYHLDIAIDPDKKSISGNNTIQYKVLKAHNIMQIDLQPPLKIEKVIQNGKELKVRSEGNAHFITLIESQQQNSINTLQVFYSGKPREAVNAPWDGGISWKKRY